MEKKTAEEEFKEFKYKPGLRDIEGVPIDREAVSIINYLRREFIKNKGVRFYNLNPKD